MYFNMSTEELEVENAEATASGSSTEDTTTQGDAPQSGEDVKTEVQPTAKTSNDVPYDRFKKVNEARKKAEELNAVYAKAETDRVTPSGKAPVSQEDFASVQQWQTYINQVADSKTALSELRTEQRIQRKMEMNEISAEADFPMYADTMSSLIAGNPSLSPRDALILAKAKSGVYEQQIKSNIEKEVKQEIMAKQKAQVGQTATREVKVVPSIDIINEKGADGKPKYTLLEIEEMLKGTK